MNWVSEPASSGHSPNNFHIESFLQHFSSLFFFLSSYPYVSFKHIHDVNALLTRGVGPRLSYRHRQIPRNTIHTLTGTTCRGSPGPAAVNTLISALSIININSLTLQMLIVFGLPQRCHSWRCFIISSERHNRHWAMSNTSLGYLRFKQTVELLTHPLLTCKYKREWPAGPRGQLQRVAIRERRERNNWLHRENRQNKKRNEPHSSIPGQHKEAKCNCVLEKKKTCGAGRRAG